MFVWHCHGVALDVFWRMKNLMIILTLISALFSSCHLTSLNHQDYKIQLKDFDWNIRSNGIIIPSPCR